MSDANINVMFELNSRLEGINKAITRVETANEKSQAFGQRLGGLSKKLLKVGSVAGIAAIGIRSVGRSSQEALRNFGEFQSVMKGVEALLGANSKEMYRLDAASRRLAKTSKFSAIEAAAGIEVLAKNGLTTSQILEGALDSSLILAAATGVDLATSADAVTDALMVFQLQASQTADVVDSMTSVVVNSKFGFNEYYEAFAKGSPSAVIAGQSIKDFNDTITATSSFFKTGQEAGTAYKVFLDRLAGSTRLTAEATTAAQEAQKKLQVEFFNSKGEMLDIANISEQLKVGIAALSKKEGIKALKDLFGTRGKNFASALATAGEEGIKAARGLSELVSAQDQAEKRMEGYKAETLKFKNAYEELKITLGEPLADYLTPFIKRARGLISGLSESLKDKNQTQKTLEINAIDELLLKEKELLIIRQKAQNILDNAEGHGTGKARTQSRERIADANTALEIIKNRLKLLTEEELQQARNKNQIKKNNEEIQNVNESLTESVRKGKRNIDVTRDLTEEEKARIDGLNTQNEALAEQNNQLNQALATTKSIRKAALDTSLLDSFSDLQDDLRTGKERVLDEYNKGVSIVEAQKENFYNKGVVSPGDLEQAKQALDRLLERRDADLKDLEPAPERVKAKTFSTGGGGSSSSGTVTTSGGYGYNPEYFAQLQQENEALKSQIEDFGIGSLFGALKPEDKHAEELARIQSEYEEKKALILENERTTQDEKNTLILDSEKAKNEALRQLEETSAQDKISSLQGTLKHISTLMQSSNKTLFRIGKAAALADAGINAAKAVSNALALPLPPPIPQILAVAAGVASAVQIAKIASQKPPQFFSGGMIGEGKPRANRDNRLINAADGEFIVNNRDSARNKGILEAMNRGVNIQALLSRPRSVAPSVAQPSRFGASGVGQTGSPDVNVFNDIDSYLDQRESQFESKVIDVMKSNQSELGIL